MRIATVVGARPQFVKAAPLSSALRRAGIEEIGIHTGQHFDDNMSGVFFRELEIPRPSHMLDIHGGSQGEMTGRMLASVEKVLIADRPDAVLVYGDTNSTLAGALAAAKLHIPVIHVEAGLRSFNRRMPEEINRVLTDDLSALLLCPTSTSIENLAREGKTAGIHHVGDLMYDATLQMMPIAARQSRILETLALSAGQFCVATVHRAENTESDEALIRVLSFLNAEAETRPIVLPLHPRTRAAMGKLQFAVSPNLRIVEPLGYLDVQALLSNAALLVTDSGGMQKEAYFHQIPCITMRGETEWVETIEHGWNRLWDMPDYQPRSPIEDYGRGDAADRIVEVIRSARLDS